MGWGGVGWGVLGGDLGVMGARGGGVTHAPNNQNCLDFMQVLRKFNKIISRRPLRVGISCENHGSATGLGGLGMVSILVGLSRFHSIDRLPEIWLLHLLHVFPDIPGHFLILYCLT